MRSALIWDLPTRLFHWLLAAGFAAAAFLALVLGEDSRLFPLHAIIGLVLALMILLRAAWGVVGTRHARFSSFLFGPRAVAAYLRGVLTGGGARHVGHNPASAYAIFAMLALLLCLAGTGVLLGRGVESVQGLHEFLAYAMVGVVVAHLAGVAVHVARHRENIVASMVDGRKAADPGEAIASARPLVGALFLLVTAAWALGLSRGYDPAARTLTLPVIGASLSLGEAEEGGAEERGEPHEADDD